MKVKLDGRWFYIPCQKDLVENICREHNFEYEKEGEE